jgi:hypothetical protein
MKVIVRMRMRIRMRMRMAVELYVGNLQRFV